MGSEKNNIYDEISVKSSGISIPLLLCFWIILPPYIASVLCSLFILCNFMTNRALRQALHNHVIFLLICANLVAELTSIPWTLNYYRLRIVWPQNISFCIAWVFSYEAIYVTATILFAWATVERHILIFHDRLISTKYKLICFHVIPIVILLLYCVFFNVFIIIAPPCENTYDYTELFCGSPLCYYSYQLVRMWDVIVHDLIPTIVIIFCNIVLLFSMFYLVIHIPRMLMEFIYRCGVSEEFGVVFMEYAEFFAVYGNILLPFLCAGSMPELQTKIVKIYRLYQLRTQTVALQAFYCHATEMLLN